MLRRRSACAGLALLALVLAGASPAGREETRSLRFTRKALFVAPYESAAVGDLDRDGHPDIVYGSYWLAGPDFVPRAYRANHAAKDYMRANSEHLYDLDKDGWLDIIAGGWGEDGIYWYRNPGRGAAERGKPWEANLPWEALLLARTRGRMEMFALHDYDGDGVPELHSVCYRKADPVEVWRFAKRPDGTPVLEPFVLGVEGGGHGLAFGDVDGDGREDVLTEMGWYERPAGEPFARAWKFHPETELPHPSVPFVVKDLNGDGRLDIIFGRGHEVGLYWWEQQAPRADGTTVWKTHVIDESWSQAHALAAADLDGDGEDELIAGKCIWAHDGEDPGAADPPAVYYYRWNKAASKFTRHTIAGPGRTSPWAASTPWPISTATAASTSPPPASWGSGCSSTRGTSSADGTEALRSPPSAFAKRRRWWSSAHLIHFVSVRSCPSSPLQKNVGRATSPC